MSCCCTAKRFLVLLALSVASFSLSASFAVGQETPAASGKPADTETKAEEAPEFIYVRMETSKGPVLLELNNAKAPISTANFVEYAEAGTYDGTIFHRVIPNFMIQGGGFTPDLQKKSTRAPIENEGGNGLKNTRGTIAMARTSDPDSATNQFFINVKDNPFLNQGHSADGASTPGKPGYAVFGRVIDGMNAVDTIRYVPTARQQMPNMPVETVTIDRMTILTPEEAKSAMEDAMKKETEAPESTVYPGDDVGEAKRVDTASGLAYYDLVEGDGASPKSPASTVKVHYSGWLTDGTMFDSSVKRGQPIDFPLNAVIPGWTEGVQSMKVGGKRKLIIPAELGYGSRGAGNAVPPNATLIFDVELLDIQD